jgi:hypothetical protein
MGIILTLKKLGAFYEKDGGFNSFAMQHIFRKAMHMV